MREQSTEGAGLSGRGVDAAPAVRPGVPRERIAAEPEAWWDRPEQQRGVAPLGRQGLREATPVFGTAQPPRGLSGLLRRAAYRVPEHRTARWTLLMAGDRLDVLEHRIARNIWILPALVAAVAGYRAMARTKARGARRRDLRALLAAARTRGRPPGAQAMRQVIRAMQLCR